MAWTNYQKILALMMVVTGSINTLATKWADGLFSENSVGKVTKFNHPFVQACSMFLGEMYCLLVFHILVCHNKRSLAKNPGVPAVISTSSFNPVIFLPPVLCDIIATSILTVGLNLTYASSFQMLRGAVMVFTGLLSIAFLNRRLKVYEWAGIAVVILGLACVGLSDILNPDKSENYSRNSIITGDLLIILAQILIATQMVLEEKFIVKNNVPPLQGAGWEGLFGFVILCVLLVPMYYIKVDISVFNNPGGQMEDALDAFVQMRNNWRIALAIGGTTLSIAFFNFAGLSVTKEMSATTRMVLDSIRTFTIWIFSLACRWQHFYWLQLVGFIILICGMCLYNDVFLRQLYNKIRVKDTNNKVNESHFRNAKEESMIPEDSVFING